MDTTNGLKNEPDICLTCRRVIRRSKDHESWCNRLKRSALRVAPAEAAEAEGGNARARAAAWQPIETAPTDGTPVTLFARYIHAAAPVVVIGSYLPWTGWTNTSFAGTPLQPLVPSHWMPNPPFPASGHDLAKGIRDASRQACKDWRAGQTGTVSPKAAKLLNAIITDMEGGFVRCGNCGEQEDTRTLDFMPQLYELRTLLSTQGGSHEQ